MYDPKKTKLSRRVCEKPIEKIKPSPENDTIYHGFSESNPDDACLVKSIKSRGLDDPIIVTKDLYVVSGHRRLAACKLAGLKTVPIRYLQFRRSDYSTLEYRRLLAEYNNSQREKSIAEKLREKQATSDTLGIYQHYVDRRTQSDTDLTEVQFRKDIKRSKISSQKSEMVEAIKKIVDSLRKYWPLTDRTIHYGLLNNPPLRNTSRPNLGRYQNDVKCYGDLCGLVTRMRLEGTIPFNCIVDETRVTDCNYGFNDVSTYISQEIRTMFGGYHRDLLQSQSTHVELIVEKLTIFNYLKPIAQEYKIPITVSRGNSGLDARYKLSQRFRKSGKRELTLLIFSDFDADGEMIAGTWANSLASDFNCPCNAFKVGITEEQAKSLKLSDSSNLMDQKTTSSNYKRFVKNYGESCPVYELEALSPEKTQELARDAITSILDMDLFNKELEIEKREATKLELLRREISKSIPEIASEFFDR